MPSKRDTLYASLPVVPGASGGGSVSDRLYQQQQLAAGGAVISLNDLIKTNGGSLNTIQ